MIFKLVVSSEGSTWDYCFRWTITRTSKIILPLVSRARSPVTEQELNPSANFLQLRLWY